MNPVFLILIILAAIALWFLLSFVFGPLGKLIYKIFYKVQREMNRTENDEKGENVNGKED